MNLITVFWYCSLFFPNSSGFIDSVWVTFLLPDQVVVPVNRFRPDLACCRPTGGSIRNVERGRRTIEVAPSCTRTMDKWFAPGQFLRHVNKLENALVELAFDIEF